MEISENDPIATFTLARYPLPSGILALAHLGLDRWPLARTEGLRFWRLLGVGRGQSFTPQADLQRYALFAVWDSLAAWRRFDEGAMMGRIQRRAEEVWTVQMRPVRWHGLWGERDPFAGMTAAPAPEAGPWIILTRASVRPAQWRTFLNAVPSVSAQLVRQPELVRSVGIGEAPLYYQATLSIWRTLPAVTSFAYSATIGSPGPHADVVKRVRREQWYSEELFARLHPFASGGTWGGTDPLA